ncbi:hypothetical protein Dsin_021563 [Dipteronia sinensis]|uniref:O-methyltransferase dimerisation domain-containing protein n=1 Tax=Dipteronia sinensis TaxID=43782 RepID=A0AAD9ZZS4_9ROSI|nr:hypothetical protein Dsin_021563 [Dipteronia sinensis]
MTPTQISDENANLFVMQLKSASVIPMVLKSALELGLLEIIAKAGPGAHLSPTEVASQLPTTNPDAPVMLDRILRLLASYSILTCSFKTLPDGKVEKVYGLAPVRKFLIKNEDDVCISAPALMNQDKVLMESCHYIVLDLGPDVKLSYASHKAVNEYKEVKGGAFGTWMGQDWTGLDGTGQDGTGQDSCSILCLECLGQNC